MRSPILLNMRTSCALILPRFFKKFFNASSLSFPLLIRCVTGVVHPMGEAAMPPGDLSLTFESKPG